MQWIKQEDELAELLREEQAVLLLHVDWSAYPHRVLPKVEALSLRIATELPGEDIKVSVVDENTLLPLPWRGSELPGTHLLGYGTIFWLQRGAVIHKLLQPYQTSVEELYQLTVRAFGIVAENPG